MRFYEGAGLLPAGRSDVRPTGGYRVYGEDAVERLPESPCSPDLFGPAA
ncbi:MerR family transcriptional regulator [Streptomyces sp. NPDC048484]